jgi:hypothetical protein
MEEETRDEIIDIVNNEEAPVKEEIKEEPVKEEVIKPKAKPRASRAKPKVKIVKESVEPVEPIVVDEPVVEPVIEEKPEPKVDKLKSIVQCPDCLLSMTQHTLKYIHKRRGFCKAVKTEAVPEKTPEPVPDQPKLKPKITEDIVNEYIKDNPDIVSTYLRNERAMKAQRKQMNARSLLNNAF